MSHQSTQSKIVKRSLISCLVVFSILGSVAHAENHHRAKLIYLTSHLGYATSQVSKSDVQSAFNKEGINGSVLSVDDSRLGWGLGVGYTLSPQWSLEFAYLDLEQVDIEFSAVQAVANLEDAHPESGDGFTLSGMYHYAITDKSQARIRLGAFNWTADYRTTQGDGMQTIIASDSGMDLYWGLGLAHQLNQALTLTTELQYFKFDNEDSRYLRLGVEWHWSAN